MAHPSVLAKRGATELDEAVSILQELLPADEYPEVHDNLYRAQRDAVGRSDESFKVKVSAGAFARLFAAQQQQIDELRDALQSKRATAKAR
jgi:hypothetical protein